MNVVKNLVAAALFALSGVVVAEPYAVGPFKLTDSQTVIYCPAASLPKSSGKCYVGVGADLSIAEWAGAAGYRTVERYHMVITEAGTVLYVIVVSK
jgi:hypothetical protein